MFDSGIFGKLSLVSFSSNSDALKKCSCLAHIINLATQSLILTRSKSKYYSPDVEDAHLPDLNARDRDEVGLVRAISVKAR